MVVIDEKRAQEDLRKILEHEHSYLDRGGIENVRAYVNRLIPPKCIHCGR